MLPGGSGGQPSNASLFHLAPNGVCHAIDVTADPVSSYLAFSPLPRSRLPTERPKVLRESPMARRFVFCGTVLGVAPTSR